MIDPQLMPLTDWLFSGPENESSDPAVEMDPRLVNLACGVVAPLPAPAGIAAHPDHGLQIRRCS